MQSTFTLRNISDAMHAKRALTAAGIPISLEKLASPTENGCGYAIRISETHYLAAVRVLRENGVSFRVKRL